MQFTTQSIGILFVVGGGILTAFHLTDIFGGNIKGRIFWNKMGFIKGFLTTGLTSI